MAARYIFSLNLINSISPWAVANLLLGDHDTSCAIIKKGRYLRVESENAGSPEFIEYIKSIIRACTLSLTHLTDLSLLELQMKDQLRKIDERFVATIDELSVFDKVFNRHLSNNNFSFCIYLILAATLRRTVNIDDAGSSRFQGSPISERDFLCAPYRVYAIDEAAQALDNCVVQWRFYEEHVVYVNFYAAKLLTVLIASRNESLILSLVSNTLFIAQDSATLSQAILLGVNASNQPLLSKLHAMLMLVEPSHPSLKIAEVELRRFDLAARTSIPMTEIELMTGIEFERALESALKALSHFKSVERTPQTRDYGADLIVTTTEDTRIAIQCKRFSSKVNLKAVQEVVAAVKHYGCDLGVVISNNGFLPSAQQLAKSNGIELWDGEAVLKIFANDYGFSDIFSI